VSGERLMERQRQKGEMEYEGVKGSDRECKG